MTLWPAVQSWKALLFHLFGGGCWRRASTTSISGLSCCHPGEDPIQAGAAILLLHICLPDGTHWLLLGPEGPTWRKLPHIPLQCASEGQSGGPTLAGTHMRVYNPMSLGQTSITCWISCVHSGVRRNKRSDLQLCLASWRYHSRFPDCHPTIAFCLFHFFCLLGLAHFSSSHTGRPLPCLVRCCLAPFLSPGRDRRWMGHTSTRGRGRASASLVVLEPVGSSGFPWDALRSLWAMGVSSASLCPFSLCKFLAEERLCKNTLRKFAASAMDVVAMTTGCPAFMSEYLCCMIMQKRMQRLEKEFTQ